MKRIFDLAQAAAVLAFAAPFLICGLALAAYGCFLLVIVPWWACVSILFRGGF